MKRYLCIVLVFILILSLSIPSFAAEDSLNQNQAPNRVAEVIELRENNSETYLLSDGSYECVVYAADKYFKNNNGDCQEIDNTIVDNLNRIESDKYRYTNAASVTKYYFAENTPDVLMCTPSAKLSFHAIDSKESAAIIGGFIEKNVGEYLLSGKNYVAYPDIFPDTDFVYSVYNGCIKEYIVLKSMDAPLFFDFEFAFDNITIKENGNGSLSFYSCNGDPIFELGGLFALDCTGNYTEAVTYKVLEANNSKAKIRIALEENYFKSSMFPILIDPTTTITGYYSIYDTFASSRYPDSNYTTNSYLRTGRDEDYYLRKSYIQFEIPASLNNTTVSSAYLSIKKALGASPDVTAYRITEFWDTHALTWNNRPSYITTNSGHLNYFVNDWYHADVTSIVQDWLNGSYRNYGFCLEDATDTGTSQWTMFYSSESDTANLPELHINYINVPDDNQFLAYGSPNNYIYIHPYSFASTWQSAIDQSRINWNNSSANVYFYTSSSSENMVYVDDYDISAYGLTTCWPNGSQVTRFETKVNRRRISADASNLSNFIQSVVVHELGHTVWLADNPNTSASSIMKYSRNRNTMTSPSQYDITNVNSKY